MENLLVNKYLPTDYKEFYNLILKNIKLSNVVVSYSNIKEIDMLQLLKYIDEQKFKYIYRPEKFSGLSLKYILKTKLSQKIEKITFLIFKTGKIVTVGLKFYEKEFLDLLKSEIELFLKNAKCTEAIDLTYKLANKVFSFDIPREIMFKNLKQLTKNQVTIKTEYNPAIFPGLTLRIPDSESVLLIFSKGKIIFTGNKTVEDMEYTIAYLLYCLKLINSGQS